MVEQAEKTLQVRILCGVSSCNRLLSRRESRSFFTILQIPAPPSDPVNDLWPTSILLDIFFFGRLLRLGSGSATLGNSARRVRILYKSRDPPTFFAIRTNPISVPGPLSLYNFGSKGKTLIFNQILDPSRSNQQVQRQLLSSLYQRQPKTLDTDFPLSFRSFHAIA